MKENCVGLEQVLAAREGRQRRQQQLLAQWHGSLICFTMNIPGPVKRTALADLAFSCGLQQLRQRLGRPVYETVLRLDTGCEAYLLYDRPAPELKAVCRMLEEQTPVGRLYDMDVFTGEGEKLSREGQRSCLVCGGEVFACSRSRRHGLEEICRVVEERLQAFAAEELARRAVEALEEEVRLTPKPGLVDERNSGAHDDMDLPLFLRSAHALQPYFCRCVALGMEEKDCMPKLQQAGQEAEQTMFQATGGVNTHKGAVYAFGLLLAAMGSCLQREDELFSRAAALAKAGEKSQEDSHGEQVRRCLGAVGARAEAENGFPSAQMAWRRLRRPGADPRLVLLEILQCCDDTNLLYRGGEDGLRLVRKWGETVLQASEEQREGLLLDMDDALIARHLSPGGCADILAQGLLLRKTEEVWRQEPLS